MVNKLLNLKGTEWKRLNFTWTVSFLHRVCFVTLWTVLIANFTVKYGISVLPYFFIIHALFIFLGSFVFSLLIPRFSKKLLLIFCLFGAVIFFLSGFFVNTYSENLFWAFIIIAEAFFLMQFRILFFGFIEEIFTPLESERTFPLIESAETIGGIIGGVLLFTVFNSLSLQILIGFWILLCFVLIIFAYFTDLFLGTDERVFKRKNLSSYLSEGSKIIFKSKYIHGVIVLVLFHLILFNLLEYLYTTSVYDNISKTVLDSGSGLEHVLVHDLGVLYMYFSIFAVFFQLFVGSRILESLGLFGAMVIHPLMLLLSLTGMFVYPSYFTSVLTKNNFSLTSVLFNNSYHSSYYALEHKFREFVREFLEGFVRPMGALIGSFFIIVMEFFFDKALMILLLKSTLALFALILFVFVFIQKKLYTNMAISDLVTSKDIDTRIAAASILFQKGHSDVSDILIGIIKNPKEPLNFRLYLINGFVNFDKIIIVKKLVPLLEMRNRRIKEAIIETLLFFINHRQFLLNTDDDPFLLQKVFDAMVLLYKKTNSKRIKTMLIDAIAQFKNVSALNFLLNNLDKKRNNLKDYFILGFRHYNSYEVTEILLPFLDSDDFKERIFTSAVLLKFPEYKDKAFSILNSGLYSTDTNHILSSLKAISAINSAKFNNSVNKLVHSENSQISFLASVILAKQGNHYATYFLVSLLANNDFEVNDDVIFELKKMDLTTSQKITTTLLHILQDKFTDDNKHSVKFLFSMRLWSFVEEYGLMRLSNLKYS